MRLAISHTTTYRFDDAPEYGLQQLRMTPKRSAGQKVVEWDMMIDGGVTQTVYTDHNNNRVTLVSFDTRANTLAVQCKGIVETVDANGVIGRHGGFAPLWYFQTPTDLTRIGTGVRRIVDKVNESASDEISRFHALAETILSEVTYKTDVTTTSTSAEEAIRQGSGVCQDHAHIFLAAARAMGRPARYVSGYLLIKDRVDQYASHAWAEVHIDNLGWLGFDVSNGISPDDRYVRVATGLDYQDAAPVSGLRFGSGGEAMAIDIQVQQSRQPRHPAASRD